MTVLFAPFSGFADEVVEPQKVLSKSIGLTGQYVWISGTIVGNIMNERITKAYSHDGVRAGIEGSLIWSFSNRLSIHARLSLTLDKLPRQTGGSCGYFDGEPDCVTNFKEVTTFGITTSPVLAFSITDWMWIEAQLGLFLGLAHGWEPNPALLPAIGVGVDFPRIKAVNIYIRLNVGTDIPFSDPVFFIPQIAAGLRF